MKAISCFVEEPTYQQLKAMAKARRQPVAVLLREAMAQYVDNASSQSSLLDLAAHPSGKRLKAWRRADLLDEMRGR